MSRRVLVVGAHAADFVWRAGGAMAKVVQDGGKAHVLALSYGERGESGELWKDPDQTIEHVKEVRRAEGEKAAAALGATFSSLDLGDYPLVMDRAATDQLVEELRRHEPDLLITHTDTDPFNPDHPAAHHAVAAARSLASGAGVSSAFPRISPPELWIFEPHQPELCGFVPSVFVDITSVIERKREAMAAMEAQQYLQTYYAQRAEQRGNHARRVSGDQEVRFAEAFMRPLPSVVKTP